MGQVPSKNKLLGGIDMDTDQSLIRENRTTFQKNLAYDVNKNADAPGGEGSNYGVLTPYEGSSPLTGITFPAGDNFCIGTYESKETNEAYVFVWNSNEDHFIYRINGDATSEIVYSGSCLNFQNSPQNFISEGRCVLITDTYTDRQTNEERLFKFLVFVDDYNETRMISVEDSIETDSFNPTTHPYFSTANTYKCSDCSDIINLGVATPMKCIGITPVPRDPSESTLQNLLNNKGWQWRIKYIDRYGRESEHGVISDRFFTNLGSDCTQFSDGIPRCVSLTIDAGCPLVEKIQIEFRTCSSSSEIEENSDWFLYDTIDKYNNCQNVPWYEREKNPEFDYNSGDNTFEYVFCGDKECQAIPVSETVRTQNPLPLTSSSVFPIDKGIGLANNVRDFNPLGCTELDKLSFTVTPPAAGCANDLKRIVVYAVIYNPQMSKMSGIWDIGSIPPLPNGAKQTGIVFGNAFCQGDVENVTDFSDTNSPLAYEQSFRDGYKGFIGYLAGTNYFAISEQYKLESSGLTKLGPLSYRDFQPYQVATGGTSPVLIQRFEFKVVPGKYSFRIASHKITTNQDYQGSSTYTAGSGDATDPSSLDTLEKELIIDVCTNDYIQDPTTEDVLCIYDLSFANPPDCTQWGRIIEGYVREDRVGFRPMELVPVTALGGSAVTCVRSDHNGFYFLASSGSTLVAQIAIDYCTGTVTRAPKILDPANVVHEDVFAMNGDNEYPNAGRRLATANVSLCDTTDTGISGVPFVMKYGPFGLTDISGDVTLIGHQRDGALAASGDTIIRTQSGGCVIVDCADSCDHCFTDLNFAYVACGGSRDVDLGDFEVAIQTSGLKGLENGGKYGIGIVLHDWMGRHSFVQANETHYINIPALTETHTFNFSTVSFSMAGIVFPSWVKYVSFYMTENLNNEDYLMWTADKVDFIDTGGNINTVTPSKIRVYYGSLTEYNKQNNFATNTNWQFLTSDGQHSVIGDYVEFIRNGDDDETWFDKTNTGYVRYSSDGAYFDIDYNADLKDLVAGALFKLVRPKACLTKFIYYELCSTIRVEAGVPETTSGTLNAFDAYFVGRQIPVPVQTGSGTTIVTKYYYNLYFEHNSPSDFYGFKCANRGRINIKNPYERQKRIGSEVALSQDITYRGSFNGLSYFIESDITTFEEQEWGAITVVIPEINTYLFLCANDNFVVGYKDTLIRTGGEGEIIAPSNAGAWGTPQRKIGSNYGCQMRDINTIRKHEGIVVFLDKQRYSILFHNFSDVKDVSINGYRSYLSSSIKTVNGVLLADFVAYIPYYHGGVDAYRREYYLTVFYAPVPGNTPTYNNNDIFTTPGGSETISISLETGVLKTFPSFVPEYYLTFEGWPYRKNMFAFKGGVAWSHRGIGGVSVDYNNFFGSQGPKVVRIVTNISPERVKKFLYNEVYCKQHKFYIDSIITESGQLSRIKPTWWEQREKFWCAAYMCAMNTFNDPNFPILATAPLTDGDPVSGRWIESRYIAEDADRGKYCELSAIVVYVTATDKSAD